MKKKLNIYSNFSSGNLLNEKNKFPFDLSSTKRIISNSNLFNKYIKSYVDLTQKLSFKKPNIALYPVLKNSSNSLIPLNKTQYNSSIEKTTLNSSINQNSTYSNHNIFICGDKKIKNTLKLKLNNFFPTNNNIILRPTKIDNLKKKKILRCLSGIKSNKEKRNNILFEDLLFKWKNSNLKYEERNIFNHDNEYKKFIQDKINYIYENKIENVTTYLNSFFEDLNNQTIHLKFHPLKIIFTPINNKDNKIKEKIIELPLSYQFLFYYKGIEFFKKILLATIKFKIDYSEIYLNENEIYEFIRENNKEISENEINENEKTLVKKRSNKNLLFIKKTLTKKNIKKNINTIDSLLNSERKISKLTINNSEKNIHLNINNYNEYNYIWITNSINFNVKITTPYVTFDYSLLNKSIMKYIEKDLFIFLLKNNFLNWEFYIMNYLLSIKIFRKYIEYNLSKSNFKEIMCSSIDSIDKEKNNDNTFLITQKKSFKYDKSDLFFSFFYTNETNINSLYKVYSYLIKIDDDELNKKKNWVFKLNFSHMKYFNNITKYESLDKFIPKLLMYNYENGNVKMDFSVFKDFSPNILNYKKLEVDINLHNNYQTERFSASNSKERQKKFNVKIEMPYIEKIEYRNKIKVLKKEINIFNIEFLRKLNNHDFNDWPLFIINNKNEWNRKDKDYLFRLLNNENNVRKKSAMNSEISFNKFRKNFRKLNSFIEFKK